MKTHRLQKPTLNLLAAITAMFSLGSISHAQFVPFKTTGMAMQIYTMSTTGSASAHNLNISIATNGIITGSGRRYDVASTAYNANPLAGAVIRLTASSKLGLPVVAQTNREVYYDATARRNLTNTYFSTNAPASILLTDNTQFKGVITKSKEVYQVWISNRIVTRTNSQIDTTLTGVATLGGRFGQGTATQ